MRIAPEQGEIQHGVSRIGLPENLLHLDCSGRDGRMFFDGLYLLRGQFAEAGHVEVQRSTERLPALSSMLRQLVKASETSE